MQTSIFTLFSLLLPLLVSCTHRQVYIVYFGEHAGDKTHDEIQENHISYLFSVKESEEEAKTSLLYSYKNSVNGFAAKLTSDEAQKLSELDEVISVFPTKVATLHTTRSWEFLNVRKGEKKNVPSENELLLKARYGKNIIVGLLDTGIWPESESFNDKGMGPIPKSWKGRCQDGEAFNSSHCNKKIIGAKYYLKGYEAAFGPINQTFNYRSPRDFFGHGTHTSSTVGGRIVHAKMNGGFGHGTASGGAPLVHLAIYKVCWPKCAQEDILAAIDDAIGDGVDVLSMSLGGPSSLEYDSIAIGSLHAVKNNIVVVCSAGNSGPSPHTVSNGAPWIFTAAASSLDRAFAAPILLGSGIKIPGESVTPYKLEEKMFPLVYAGNIEEPHVITSSTGLCYDGSLSPVKAKGKIVLCLREDFDYFTEGVEVKRAGGAGLILGNAQDHEDELYVEYPDVLPMAAVTSTNAQKILKYIRNSTHQFPIAYINPARTILNVKPAPYIASFSSRGPYNINPDILKPDITAPGLNILAAWTESPLSPMKYKVESGTSMACPHVAAVAALIKAIHPTWRSAAIRSAIITTAGQTNNMKRPITDNVGEVSDPFQYGSGHLRPTLAADPGLVYDASYTDYLLFNCTSSIKGKSFDKSFKCPKHPPSPNNLNYPSLAISKLKGKVVIVNRTVTNVGDSTGAISYVSHVESPPGISVKVSPSVLKFNHSGEKRSFTIRVETKRNMTRNDVQGYVFGSYSWSDGIHVVRSPIAINLS